MKKILSGAMILILLLLFAATYVCSSRTEAVFKAEIERINQNYSGLLQVELVDYRRGLLLSEAKTRLDMRGESLLLEHQLRHFPWMVRALSRVDAAATTADPVERQFLEQLQLQTDVSLDGAADSRFELPQLTISAEGSELQLQGLSFSTRLEAGLNAGMIDFRLQQLSLNEPGVGELQVAGMQLQSDFRDLQGIPLGSGMLQLERLTLTPGVGDVFALQGLSYQVVSEQSAATLNSSAELRLTGLQLGGERFHEGRLVLKIVGIEADAARRVQQELRQLQRELYNQQTDPLLLQLRVAGLYSQLLSKGVSLSLEQLSLQGDPGALQGEGRFEVTQSASGGVLQALNGLQGQLQLQLDQALFSSVFRLADELQHPGRKTNRAVLNEQAEQLAGALVQKGILTRQAGAYRLDFSLAQGTALLNGQPAF